MEGKKRRKNGKKKRWQLHSLPLSEYGGQSNICEEFKVGCLPSKALSKLLVKEWCCEQKIAASGGLFVQLEGQRKNKPEGEG